jgi:hypothetical protein
MAVSERWDSKAQLGSPLEKHGANDSVHASVGLLTRATFMEFTVNVLAVRFVTRGEILFDGNHQSTGAEYADAGAAAIRPSSKE